MPPYNSVECTKRKGTTYSKNCSCASCSMKTPWKKMKINLPVEELIEKLETKLEAQKRKDTPVFSGVLKYFPLALQEIARVSKAGNDQHHPGEPLHWDRTKSTDELDALTRHLLDHASGNVFDTDGQRHLAKCAWRCLAQLQKEIENESK